ncbi:MAG: hypothetical protein CFE45_25380 [Burkholderiales bacterium PBB5]|nr:MAG: hypothetical protein CFE45_25380 [Burkholderiales bacterium PBB5]
MADRTDAVALPERLTMGEARAPLAQVCAALQAAQAPVIDASALRELDTAAVALLLDCQRQAHARGLTLQVVGAPPKLAQLAQLYGVDALLGLQVSAPAAPAA